MTLSTKIEVFYGFYICSQWAFIHALLSRVPFALAGLSCYLCHADVWGKQSASGVVV